MGVLEDKPVNSERIQSLGLYLLFGTLVILLGVFNREHLLLRLQDLETVMTELKFWGPILTTIIASLWAILCLPGPIILGFIGTVYSEEPLLAIFIAVVADSVAEVVGFLVARHLGRKQLVKILSKKPWFKWLEEQTEQRGIYGVFVVRMMPFFPNSLANYAFGLLRLRFWPYLVASILGSIPNLTLYIVGTAGVIQVVRHGFGHQSSFQLAIGALVLTAILLLGMQAVFRRFGQLSDEKNDSPST